MQEIRKGNRPRFTGIFPHKFEKYLVIPARTRRQAFLVTQESCIPPPSSDSPIPTTKQNRPKVYFGFICFCAEQENRTPVSSLARTCSTTEPIPHIFMFCYYSVFCKKKQTCCFRCHIGKITLFLQVLSEQLLKVKI